MRARLVFLILMCVSCKDPVRDERVRELGDEDPNVPVGVDHRPGQPCLVCHSEGGPADDKPFAVAGTIFATPAPNAKGAPGIEVRFVDSGGSSPRLAIFTAPSGNFFVTTDQWPDLTFPFRTAIFDASGKSLQVMQSVVDREGSCNFCHDPNADGSQSIGPIWANAGAMP